MASTIASPAPQQHIPNQPPRKDFANLQLHDEGRSTPLPQYEKTQSVPFALTLQEDKSNPGQFQLVVNINPENKRSRDKASNPAASKKLYANLQAFPSLGYDVSTMYRTQKSSPPTSPQREKQEWSDLDAIPSDFLQKVVPDWNVTFERKDSTASTHSRKLADIKARIKKSGRGFVVRLLKGSNADSNEVAEVHLGRHGLEDGSSFQELDSQPRAELDSTEVESVPLGQQGNAVEIGTSGDPGIPRIVPQAPAARIQSIPDWLGGPPNGARARNSVIEEGFSDAETLTQEVRSIGDMIDDEATDLEPFSRHSSKLPTRTTSVSSIVKTPTRGLSVVGPVRRMGKSDRTQITGSNGKHSRLDLGRSDAKKSFKRRSPRNSYVSFATTSALQQMGADSMLLRYRPRKDPSSPDDDLEDQPSSSSNTRHHPSQSRSNTETFPRRSSAEDLPGSAKQKTRLRLQTDIARPKSASTSPITKRKRPRRLHKPTPSSSSVQFVEGEQHSPTVKGSEVDISGQLRDALEKAFGPVPSEPHSANEPIHVTVPRIEEPQPESGDNVGQISLPAGLEIRSAPVNARSPLLTFWGLALSAIVEKTFEGLHTLQQKYGNEPPVPENHARVRWTCSCGESLYDDFVERRPGAARLLEAYLNRPRAHTPTSPSGRTSASSTMTSVFDSVSRASTLATPISTYGGSASWGKGTDISKYSPTRIRSSNPFSVRMGSFIEEQWLLTCANEGRFTPKIVHIDVNSARIRSDKDLALALRDHYDQLNRRWFSWLKLRGLTTIEFVQFEVHRNRFADIRAAPSMPPTHSASSDKAPSEHPYSFEPVDLIPPVGSTYLLHLFKHPSDYDGELITYLRSPKRRERLEFGLGWGINLVEGFLAQKVWMCFMLAFGVGSGVFAIVWTVKKGDVQGAFGVAGWVVTLAGLILGGLQAWLE